MIEEGRHVARAVEWKLGITGQGTEQIAVMFETADRQTCVWYGYFSEKTVERTLESLDHMGWDGQDISNPRGLDQNEVSIVVEHEQNDEGKTFPRVRWVNRVGGGLVVKEELQGGALQSFKQRMQGAVMMHRQKNPGAARPSNGANSPAPVPPRGSYADPNPDDDIPF